MLSDDDEYDTNLYDQNDYKQFEGLDCSKIKEIIKEPMFTHNNIEEILSEKINYNDAMRINFIQTNEAKIRIAKILLAQKANIPLIITGPTCSAKTFSVLAAFEIFKAKNKSKILIRQNLSEDSTRFDLLGSISFDNQINQFVFKKGPFTEAFEKGHWILLDELSLAPPSVLQAIEACLDSNKLTIQEIGGTKEIDMHHGFFLVCTTNPNNEEYLRYNLSKEFCDRFLSLTFDTLSSEEMSSILTKKCDILYNDNHFNRKNYLQNDIQQIIDAHHEYSSKNNSRFRNSFTLREFDKAYILLKKEKNADQIIDILYRTRSGEKILTYNPAINPFNNLQNFFTGDKQFINTTDRFIYGQLALDCLKAGFNIILESKHFYGTSCFAEAIAREFNSKPPLIMTMTEELNISDITEFSIPFTNKINGKTEMNVRIQKGLIYRGMEEGRVIIINDIERGNTRIIESFNDIFESNFFSQSMINFKRPAKINQNFRIIFTIHSDSNHRLSPSFFNRFIHIKMINQEKIFNFEKPIDELNINQELKETFIRLCNMKQKAPTSQTEKAFFCTRLMMNSQKPLCFVNESGFGKSIGIKLSLEDIYKDPNKIHIFYCTSETSAEDLIGKYIFDGQLYFHEGPLLKAAINGEPILFKNIDKLTFTAFTYVEAILNYSKKKEYELILPGFDLSTYNLSKEICFLATIDQFKEIDIPYYILKYFTIIKIPEPEYDDYYKISELYPDILNSRPEFIKSLIECFISCRKNKNIYDTSFRMFNRALSSIYGLCEIGDPVEKAISLFGFHQNVKDYNKFISLLEQKITCDKNKIKDELGKDVSIDNSNNKLIKGYLSFDIKDSDIYMSMSEQQLNTAFYLVSCQYPIILVGNTSFKETLIKKIKPNVSIFYSTSDTTQSDLIGNTTIKKNDNTSGKFGKGEVYDMLIKYLTLNSSLNEKLMSIDFFSDDAINNIELIINDIENENLKAYYIYLINLIKNKSQFVTVFELGFLFRELLLNKSLLIKNIDELDHSIIDSIIPFLNEETNFNEYFPGIVKKFHNSIFFTCSEHGLNKIPSYFRSRTQIVNIGPLRRDDLDLLFDDNNLLNSYYNEFGDYSDIMKAINIIKIAQVLNKFGSAKERITIAHDIIETKAEKTMTEISIFGLNENEKIYSLNEIIEYDEKTKELKSIRTGASIIIDKFDNEPLLDIILIPCIAYMLDLCIISLAANIPLIIESAPGQSKSTLIQKLATSFGKIPISTNMSKNRTIEEFIGQIIPSGNEFKYEIGDLYKYIENDVFYIIDEINLSNQSLLLQFLTVFKAPYGLKITHPHELKSYKKKFHLFATMNPVTLTADRSYLPQGFISCSIMYKMPNYSNWDIGKIIIPRLSFFKNKFDSFQDSINFIVECHKKCMQYSNDITIRDIIKLEEAFKSNNSKEKISKNEIASFVKLIYSSKINNYHEILDPIVKKYIPNSDETETSVTYTKQEHLLMNQMTSALKLNRGIIIRGSSGSGKTHCIRNLAEKEFDGKNHTLYTIQLCEETDKSELLGRYEPDYPNIKKQIGKLIENIEKLLGIHHKNMSTNSDNLINQKLRNYYIDLTTKKEKINVVKHMSEDNDLMKIQEISSCINKCITKSNSTVTFKYQNSPLIDAMKNGDWVVLDNINLCRGDILELLNSLLDESHSLRINIGNNDTIYTMNPNPNIKQMVKIHEDFRLIMTSDDRNEDNFNIIPTPFLSRCIVIRINNPDNDQLNIIARNCINYINSPFYPSFFAKCLTKKKENNTRDIIRIMKMFKLFYPLKKIKNEVIIGKVLKFILDSNHSIPNSYIKFLKNDEHADENSININDYSEKIFIVLCIIQKNLLDQTLDDKDFYPLNCDFIRKLFKELVKININNSLKKLFKATLRLSCYVYSKINIQENNNNKIQEKLITFLLCGYLLSSNPKKTLPMCIWKLNFKPAIWDFLFLSTDKYTKLTTKDGFLDFISDRNLRNSEFEYEFQNYFNVNAKNFEKNNEQNLKMIDTFFSRVSINNSDHDLFPKTKNKVKIEKLPLSFPSIPKNLLFKNEIKYLEFTDLFNYFDINPENKTIFKQFMKSFNFDYSCYEIIKDYDYLYCSRNDTNICKEYGDLLDYDKIYQICKEINKRDQNNLYEQIKCIANNNFYSLDIMKTKINEAKSNLSFMTIPLKDPIIEIFDKAKSIIDNANKEFINRKLMTEKQNEIMDKINRLRSSVKNEFIKKDIEDLLNTSSIDDQLMEKIQNLILFDNCLAHNVIKKSINYDKLKKFSLPENKNITLKTSAILTSFIVPAFCEKFNLSYKIFEQLKFYLNCVDIKNIVNQINSSSLNKSEDDFTYIGKLLKEMKFIPVQMKDLQNKETLSQMINYMDSYSIDSCISIDEIEPKQYIQKMLNSVGLKKLISFMKNELDEPKMHQILDEYRLIEDDDSIKEVSEKILREKCPSIPPEHWGESTIMKFDQKNITPANLIAHFLTSIEAQKYNIEYKDIRSVNINDQIYYIIPKEILLLNYIYVSYLDDINNSIALKCELINDILDVSNPKTPNEFLKKDIIIHFSQITDGYEMEIFKNKYMSIMKKEDLNVSSFNLHYLYNRKFKEKVQKFLESTNDKYIKLEDLEFFAFQYQKLDLMVKKMISEIKATFIYLLKNNSCIYNNQQKQNILKYIYELADFFLIPANCNSSEEMHTIIKINDYGDHFIDECNNISDCEEHVYFKKSIEYDEGLIINDDDTFENCYSKYCKIKKIYIEMDKIYSYIDTINKYSDIEYSLESIKSEATKANFRDIINLSAEIISKIHKIKHDYERFEPFKPAISGFSVPIIIYRNIENLFYDACNMLMLVYNNGKIQLLNKIDYYLGNCTKNTTLSINIINLTQESILTDPNIQINQANDLIKLTMNIDNENQIVNLYNKEDKTIIDSFNIISNFVDDEIYLVFSIPVTLNEYININETIYHELIIQTYSNSSSLNHITELKTLAGSEIHKKFVKIEDTNGKINIKFSQRGKFIATLKVVYVSLNIQILIYINANVETKIKRLIYDAKTLTEIKQDEKIPEFSQIIVKSPFVQKIDNSLVATQIDNNYPYIQMLNTKKKSILNYLGIEFLTNQYYNIQFNVKIKPRLKDFEKNIINTKSKPIYFCYSHQNIDLYEKYKENGSIVELIFSDNKLDSLLFNPDMTYCSKNYCKEGILISKKKCHYQNHQIDLLINQIKEQQKIEFDKNKDKIIPWINIISLFDNDKCDINPIDLKKLLLNNDQTYYVLVNKSSILPERRIPDSVIKNTIKKNVILANEIDLRDFIKLKSLNYYNLYTIIENLSLIKLGIQLYTKIYDFNKNIASIIANIYNILANYVENGIMVNTFEEIVSIGKKVFLENDFPVEIEIIKNFDSKYHNNIDVSFKFPIKKNNKVQNNDAFYHSDSNHNQSNNEIQFPTFPYNQFNYKNLFFKKSDQNNQNFYNDVFSIMTRDEIESISIQTDEKNIITLPNDDDNDTDNKKKIDGAILNLKNYDFDESQAPINEYNRSKSKNKKLHELSDIEIENKNILLNEENIREGELPNLDEYIINALAFLTKSEFTLSLTQNPVTIAFDISILSGKNNKDFLATNMMVFLELLNAFDIKFSVWMFADRNLCFCIKKPQDSFDKARQTLIRDAYYLDRINPESDVLSAIFTINNLKSEHFTSFEYKSNLMIMFSTFVSSQVLSKQIDWQKNASIYLMNKKFLGIVEPCQHINKDINNALTNSLTESNSMFFIKQNDICETAANILLKIFEICQDKSQECIKNPIIQYHEFKDDYQYENEIYVCKNSVSGKINKCDLNFDLISNDVFKQKKFDLIDFTGFIPDEVKYLNCLFYPNKATKYMLTSHGSIIDSQALMKLFFTNHTNLNIFKQKIGAKIRNYSVDILIDDSSIMRYFSINHCFLSVISLLLSLKELNITNVNLVIAGYQIVPMLVKKEIQHISIKSEFSSKLYSLLIDNATEFRSLDLALKQIVSHSIIDSSPHVLFMITDAIIDKEQQNNIKNILTYIQMNGSKVIGIGTGPTPYKIEDIFTWSVWSKNPLHLREALWKLTISQITKNVFNESNSFKNIPKNYSKIKSPSVNLDILKQFSDTEFKNIYTFESINFNAFDPSKFTGNYQTDSKFDACKDGTYKGYKVLIMMFYQGIPDQNIDRLITIESFERGFKDLHPEMKSPGEKLKEKGFDYCIVTSYKNALIELTTGKYSIAMLCTASTGELKNIEDENYFESFLNGIKQFHERGGSLLLFGENPPFIFEINHILERLNLTVRLDSNIRSFDPGGELMSETDNDPTNGEFQSCVQKIKATINGVNMCLPSLGGGLKSIYEGKTLAKFINIDASFKIFSITNNGNPSCIYRFPLNDEGVIIIDSGSSKLFYDYTEEGTARYIINLLMGCVHYSKLGLGYYNSLEDKGIKVDVNIERTITNLFMKKIDIYPPLLISIIIDATGSMWNTIKSCRKKIRKLVEECQRHTNEISIYLQLVAYRDLSELNTKVRMIESINITSNFDEIVTGLNNIKAQEGGNDGPENISAGFKESLNQIERNPMNFRNIFILISDAPNQDPSLKESNFPRGNENDETWETVWKNIDNKMEQLEIDALIAISCDSYFEKQYDIWNNYGCNYILSILDRQKINRYNSFESIFVNHVSERVSSMY